MEILGRIADAAEARKPETPEGTEERTAEEKRRSIIVAAVVEAILLNFIPYFGNK